MTNKKEDLVPHYRPGTTEPEMVPRSSVEGTSAIAGGAEPIDAPKEGDGGVVTDDEPKSGKKSAKKAARKK